MRDVSSILKTRQSQMRREMDRRGLSMKGVSYDSGIPYSTLLSYFPDEKGKAVPALMPVSAQYALCDAVPDDILSLLLPDDRRIVRVPEGIDHDEIAEVVADYLLTKERAHHPDSEAGREIGPKEDETLRGKVAVLRSVA
ncbi:MAG: hypothetical protein V4527_18230 [Pseudomonadota bacterium]